jgi:Cu-Zn family superoxide dismutase
MKNLTLVAAATLVALAACRSAPQQPNEEELRATAALQPTTGNKAFGEATFEPAGSNKVHVIVFAQNLKPGAEHGLHIHEAGDCSSGAHGKVHDLPSLKAQKNGRAKLDTVVEAITLTPGPASIVGRGLVIYSDPDDYKTQPAGNSGARIACGVIKAG